MSEMTRVRTFLAAVGAAAVGIVLLPTTASALVPGGTTERVSVTSEGRQGNDISGRLSAPDVSADGLVVAFDSQADNLTVDDTNGFVDVFAHDRVSGVTDLISVSNADLPGDDDSQSPSADATGQLIAFESDADNLVADDDNGARDVFVRDRAAGTTEVVSVNNRGNLGNGFSNQADITPDGRFVAFGSASSNLVRGDTNATTDIFVRDRARGTTQRVSVASDGTQANLFSSGPSISDNGRFVAFASFANTLAPNDDNGNLDIFLHDMVDGTTVLVTREADGTSADGLSAGPSISGDGSAIAFFSDAPDLVPADGNETRDVFVALRAAAGFAIERVSVSSAEEEADGQSSFSQRGSSSVPDINADGRFVTFDSFATNLVHNDTNETIDAFTRDVVRGTTVRVSVSAGEMQGDGASSDTAVSADGGEVAFVSQATNLVRRDTNRCPLFTEPGSCPDVFVRVLSSTP